MIPPSPSPKNKPQDKHPGTPDTEKDHKPLLSRITVVREKSLLSKFSCFLPRPSFPLRRVPKGLTVSICVQPHHPSVIPHQSRDGNKTKQDVKSRRGRFGKWQTLRSLWKWFRTMAACYKDLRSLQEMLPGAIQTRKSVARDWHPEGIHVRKYIMTER